MLDGEIYARVFEEARGGLLLLETESGRILRANPAFSRIAGRSHGELTGRVFWEPPLVADATAGVEIRNRLISGGVVEFEELPLEMPGGSFCVLEISAVTIDEQTLVEARDVTTKELRRREDRMEALRHSAARAAVEFQRLRRTLCLIGELLVAAAGQG